MCRYLSGNKFPSTVNIVAWGPREQMNGNLWYWVISHLVARRGSLCEFASLGGRTWRLANTTAAHGQPEMWCWFDNLTYMQDVFAVLSESHLLLVALFLLARMVFFGVSDICFSFCRGLHKPGSFTLQQSSWGKQWRSPCFKVFDDVGWGRRLVLKYFPTW